MLPVLVSQGTHQEISIPETVESLTTAGKVLIVPGYGLAVANAQHSIAELTKMLKKKGVEVRGRAVRATSGHCVRAVCLLQFVADTIQVDCLCASKAGR
jgi:NAD/NADP transhydrogenase beta subunit